MLLEFARASWSGGDSNFLSNANVLAMAAAYGQSMSEDGDELLFGDFCFKYVVHLSWPSERSLGDELVAVIDTRCGWLLRPEPTRR